jgi:hypothetical protein
MILIILAIFILLIYFASPLIGKIVLLIANQFIPDPIPFVDEIIMYVGLFAHLNRLLHITNFIALHKKVIKKILLILLIAIVVTGIIIIIYRRV